MNKTKTKLFYGWYIVLAGFIITGASVGFYNNCLGVFVKPVCDALGFSRGEFTLYATVSIFSSIIAMPFYGELFRKVSLKKLMLLGAVACGLIPIGYSFSTKLWQFYLLAFLNGMLLNSCSMMIMGTVINNWFKEKKGMACGIAFAGSGLFAAMMVPLATNVIAQFGWQWGYRLIGIAGMILLVPTILLIVRDTPQEMGLLPYGENPDTVAVVASKTPELSGLTRAQAIKTPAFWLLSCALFLCGFTTMGIQPHTIAYLTDIGFDYGFASNIVSVLMFSMIFGKLLLGYLFDKSGALRASILGASATLLAVILIILLPNAPAIAWIYAICMGFACSTGSVAVNYLPASYFGDKDFPRILSLITMATNLGISIATPLSGAIYDVTGSYISAWYLFTVTAVLEIICMFLAYYFGSRVIFPKQY